jgi:hypothetical protein
LALSRRPMLGECNGTWRWVDASEEERGKYPLPPAHGGLALPHESPTARHRAGLAFLPRPGTTCASASQRAKIGHGDSARPVTIRADGNASGILKYHANEPSLGFPSDVTPLVSSEKRLPNWKDFPRDRTPPAGLAWSRSLHNCHFSHFFTIRLRFSFRFSVTSVNGGVVASPCQIRS